MDRAARIPVQSREEFDRWFWDHGSMERPGDGQSQRPTALQAVAPADLSPGHSIDFDWVTPPPPTIANVAWYRHRAEECGDLAAELLYEGLDGTAYGQAMRAAHYGRIALDLYEQRRRGNWAVPGHAGNFL